MIIEDTLDLKILRILCEDGRKSYRSLAEELGKSPATIKKHVEELENSGVIKNYGIQVDFDKIGFQIIAIIELTVSGGQMLNVEEKIASNPHVFGVYDVTGSYDAMILARFKNRNALSEFIKKINSIDHVQSTNTQLVLNIIKDNSNFNELVKDDK